MSAADYRCASMGCGETAVAVRISLATGGIYGSCAEHLRPLDEARYAWVYKPPAPEPEPEPEPKLEPKPELTDDDVMLLSEAIQAYYEGARGALLMELRDPKRNYSPVVRAVMQGAANQARPDDPSELNEWKGRKFVEHYGVGSSEMPTAHVLDRMTAMLGRAREALPPHAFQPRGYLHSTICRCGKLNVHPIHNPVDVAAEREGR